MYTQAKKKGGDTSNEYITKFKTASSTRYWLCGCTINTGTSIPPQTSL